MLTLSLVTRYEGGSAPLERPFFANAKATGTVLLVDTRRQRVQGPYQPIFCPHCGARGEGQKQGVRWVCGDCGGTGRAR